MAREWALLLHNLVGVVGACILREGLEESRRNPLGEPMGRRKSPLGELAGHRKNLLLGVLVGHHIGLGLVGRYRRRGVHRSPNPVLPRYYFPRLTSHPRN